MGAPLNNVNAMKNGSRARRPGVALAKLGPRFHGPYQQVSHFRKLVRRELEQRYGNITLSQYARLQSLARIELSSRIMEQQIRDDAGMSTEDLRQARSLINQWTRERDNILAELLGEKPGEAPDPWRAFYAAQQSSPPSRPSQTAGTAPDATGDATANQAASLGIPIDGASAEAN